MSALTYALLPRAAAALLRPRRAQGLRVARRALAMSAGAGAPPAPSAVVTYVTVPNAEVGSALARALVSAKLAACVNVVPGVRSVYTWKGEVCEDDELLLIIKSRAELTGQLEEAVRALHPYDTPEVIALPVVAGSAPYLAWLHESTAGASVAAALARRGKPLRDA